MAQSLSTSLRVALTAIHANAIDLGAASMPLGINALIELADGTGADQANALWSDTRTLSASASENLDLAGSLTDVFGATLTFTRVKLLLVRAASGNTNDVLVGGAASNAWVGPFNDATDVAKIKPGGLALFVARDATAYPVTAGTGDILKVANSSSGTSVSYDIVVVGCV